MSQLIAKNLYTAIRHALGGDPANEYPYQDIVNDAGEWLVACHRWAWTVREATTLGITADQEYVELPADFLELVAAEPSNNITSTFIPTTYDKLLELRTNPVTTTNFHFHYAVSRRELSSESKAVLELWPVPATTEADKFTIMYRRGWTRVANDNDVVVMPTYMHPLFRRVCRAFAAGVELEDLSAPVGRQNTLDDVLDRLVESKLWEAAVGTDRMQQASLGVLEGGHTSMLPHNVASTYLSTTVQGPT